MQQTHPSMYRMCAADADRKREKSKNVRLHLTMSHSAQAVTSNGSLASNSIVNCAHATHVHDLIIVGKKMAFLVSHSFRTFSTILRKSATIKVLPATQCLVKQLPVSFSLTRIIVERHYRIDRL